MTNTRSHSFEPVLFELHQDNGYNVSHVFWYFPVIGMPIRQIYNGILILVRQYPYIESAQDPVHIDIKM